MKKVVIGMAVLTLCAGMAMANGRCRKCDKVIYGYGDMCKDCLEKQLNFQKDLDQKCESAKTTMEKNTGNTTNKKASAKAAEDEKKAAADYYNSNCK